MAGQAHKKATIPRQYQWLQPGTVAWKVPAKSIREPYRVAVQESPTQSPTGDWIVRCVEPSDKWTFAYQLSASQLFASRSEAYAAAAVEVRRQGEGLLRLADRYEAESKKEVSDG